MNLGMWILIILSSIFCVGLLFSLLHPGHQRGGDGQLNDQRGVYKER